MYKYVNVHRNFIISKILIPFRSPHQELQEEEGTATRCRSPWLKPRSNLESTRQGELDIFCGANATNLDILDISDIYSRQINQTN